MLTNRERVTRGLELLTEGLYPFVERELKGFYKDDWIRAARSSFREDRGQILPKGDVVRWDAHALLTVMWDHWNSVFKHKLGPLERSLVCEIRDFRNRWAHQQDFDFGDTYRILDSIERLLRAVSSNVALAVAHEKDDLLREHVAEEVNSRMRMRDALRDKFTVVTIYALCCAAIVTQALYTWGRDAWVLVGALITFFAYMIYKKLMIPLPILGPHECNRCRKIIYVERCPYCEPVRRLLDAGASGPDPDAGEAAPFPCKSLPIGNEDARTSSAPSDFSQPVS